MDLSFRFDRMRAKAAPAPADVALLLASLAAEQASSPTATVAVRAAGSGRASGDYGTVVALFTGASDWAAATHALGGSFHPRIALAAAGKAGATLMKPGFTFAF